jgi:hypothetical protein
VLVSEKNRMKIHTNQWLWIMPYPSEYLAGATRRSHIMAPEIQQPAQCPDRGRPHREGSLQLLENKALSWGIIRESAGTLAEIM